jgi:hypothetical protein
MQQPSLKTDRTSPPGLRDGVRWLSIGLAVMATGELIAADIFSLLAGQRIWPLLLLPVGWILFYTITYAIAASIAALNPNDPTVKNQPQFSFQIVTVRQPQLAAAIVLISFPAIMALIAAAILFSAITGQLHP